MANLAQAFAGGFESGQAIGDTIVADRDLSKAKQETSGADLFSTYQRAGQMAMQSGNSRVADKFLKQANEYKGAALDNHIKELKVHQADTESLYQDIQSLGANPSKTDVLSKVEQAAEQGRLTSAEKLDYYSAIKNIPDEQIPKYIEQFGKATLSYKEQLQTQAVLLKAQEDKWYKDQMVDIKRSQLRIQADKSSGSGNKAEVKLQDKIDAVDTHLETEIAGIEGKDPHKFDEKEKARQIASAKNRAQVRKQQLQQRQGNKKTADKKESKPSYGDWLKAAKEKNPGVPDSELKAFYDKAYKE